MNWRCDAFGLVSLVNCFDIPCAYLISKGYIPMINMLSSDYSIYSDFEGDDIWSKFSECGYFIASGGCTGTGLVQKLENGRHSKSFVFDLGGYE